MIPEPYMEMIITYGERLLLALVLFIVGRIIIRAVMRCTRKAAERKELDPTLRSFIFSILSAGLNILLLITVASTLGIQMTSFIAVLGAAGLAVGLALQGSLSNFAGGVLILMFRPFSVGNFIEAQGFMGTVVEIRVLYTVLNTFDNKRVVIPNGSLANSSVTNFSINPTRRVDFVFGISYADSITHAKSVITQIIEAHEFIEKEPAPVIGVVEHAESSINIAVRVWCKREHFLNVMFSMNELVKDTFDREGITIPFPQRDVHVYSQEVKPVHAQQDA